MRRVDGSCAGPSAAYFDTLKTPQQSVCEQTTCSHVMYKMYRLIECTDEQNLLKERMLSLFISLMSFHYLSRHIVKCSGADCHIPTCFGAFSAAKMFMLSYDVEPVLLLFSLEDHCNVPRGEERVAPGTPAALRHTARA